MNNMTPSIEQPNSNVEGFTPVPSSPVEGLPPVAPSPVETAPVINDNVASINDSKEPIESKTLPIGVGFDLVIDARENYPAAIEALVDYINGEPAQ